MRETQCLRSEAQTLPEELIRRLSHNAVAQQFCCGLVVSSGGALLEANRDLCWAWRSSGRRKCLPSKFSCPRQDPLLTVCCQLTTKACSHGYFSLCLAEAAFSLRIGLVQFVNAFLRPSGTRSQKVLPSGNLVSYQDARNILLSFDAQSHKICFCGSQSGPIFIPSPEPLRKSCHPDKNR
jgi:hypothetical protein